MATLNEYMNHKAQDERNVNQTITQLLAAVEALKTKTDATNTSVEDLEAAVIELGDIIAEE